MLRVVRAFAVLSLLSLLLPTSVQAQSYTITPTPFQTAFNNSGVIINNACIWTYTAGTSTPATTYSDTIGTSNSNPIRSDSAGRFTAYLLTGALYKFQYESACTPPAHGTILRTADFIAATPPSTASVDITGVAGETISANQCVYLSDGSGAKTAGSWYKCDSANAYSSTLPEVGLATTAIATAATGTIRLSGAVTGLAGLSLGTSYYAGAAGAITATAPVQARKLGVADTATSLVLKDIAPQIQPWVDDFRLTLTTAVPVTSADVTGASAVTVFCTPYGGNRIDLPDSLGNPTRVTSAEFSIAVPATTATMYSVFAFNNAGVATLELTAWTNDTTPGAANAVRTTNGRLLKTADNTRLFLGVMRTGSVAGQSEDSAAKRFLWNYYNRALKSVKVTDSTDTWVFSTNGWQQANNSTANQIAVISFGAEQALTLRLTHLVFNSTNTARVVEASIGWDSAVAPHADAIPGQISTNAQQDTPLHASLVIIPASGFHFAAWLEHGNGTDVQTWYGDGGAPTLKQTGLTGTWAS